MKFSELLLQRCQTCGCRHPLWHAHEGCPGPNWIRSLNALRLRHAETFGKLGILQLVAEPWSPCNLITSDKLAPPQ